MQKAYMLLSFVTIVLATDANACVTASSIPKDFAAAFTGTVEAMPHEKMEAANHFNANSIVYIRVTNTTQTVAPITVAIESGASELCKATIQLKPEESRTYVLTAKQEGPADYTLRTLAAAAEDRIAVSLVAYTSPAPRWQLRLTNSDDYTRAILNGEEVIRCEYRSTCKADLTAYLRPGKPNNLLLETTNTGQGYTYTWELFAGGVKVAGKSCGIAGEQPCEGNWAANLGVVYQETVTIPYW